MAVRRSEVFFGLRGEEFYNVKFAKAQGRAYYAFADYPQQNVYHADMNRHKVCKVCDLIDDTPPVEEDPFPPLPPEVTSDTPADRAFDGAMRGARG